MATVTRNFVRRNVMSNIKKIPVDVSEVTDKLGKYALVMSFADEMLESGILSEKEYADFAVKTASKYALNLCSLQR